MSLEVVEDHRDTKYKKVKGGSFSFSDLNLDYSQLEKEYTILINHKYYELRKEKIDQLLSKHIMP